MQECKPCRTAHDFCVGGILYNNEHGLYRVEHIDIGICKLHNVYIDTAPLVYVLLLAYLPMTLLSLAFYS